jgi:hypothetical protein
MLPSKGMPARGSIQDRIASEVLIRERRRGVVESVYLAKVISAGLRIPEKLFQLWTHMLSMEVFQESYQPEVVKEKEHALKLIQENVTQKTAANVRMFKKLQSLTVKDADLRKPTPEQVEEFQRKLRRRYLKT